MKIYPADKRYCCQANALHVHVVIIMMCQHIIVLKKGQLAPAPPMVQQLQMMIIIRQAVSVR